MSTPRNDLIIPANSSAKKTSLLFCYTLLKLTPQATAHQIHTAYRKQAAKYHVDKLRASSDLEKENAAQLFNQITFARDALLQNLQLQNANFATLGSRSKEIGFFSNSSRAHIREQMSDLLKLSSDFLPALNIGNIVTKNSVVNILNNSYLPALDKKIEEDMQACINSFKNASRTNSSFNLADYPYAENIICLHQEANKVQVEWLSKLAHLSKDNFIDLILAFSQSNLPIKETCLAFSEISNDREIIFEFTSGISHLREEKLDSLENIDALYQAGKYAQELSNGLIGLYKAGLLTEENRKLLIELKEKSGDLGRGFEMVHEAIKQCEDWRKGFGYHFLNLKYRIMTQNNFIRLAASNYPDGICYAISELASLQRNIEQDLFTFVNVNTIFCHARFMLLGNAILFSHGAKDLFFKLRCERLFISDFVGEIFELSHLSEIIDEKIVSTISLNSKQKKYELSENQMQSIFTSIKDQIKDEFVLQTSTNFLDMLNKPLSEGSSLSQKLSHISTDYIVQYAMSCLRLKLNIPNALEAAAILNKTNFKTLIIELNAIPLASNNGFTLFQYSKQTFASLIERIEKLKSENNHIEPIVKLRCSIM